MSESGKGPVCPKCGTERVFDITTPSDHTHNHYRCEDDHYFSSEKAASAPSSGSQSGKGSPVRAGDRVRVELSVTVEYSTSLAGTTGDEAEGVRDVVDLALCGIETHRGYADRTIRIDSYGLVDDLSQSDRHPTRPH